MTDRIRLDDLTSDQLDQLYERVATAEQEADASVAAAAHLTTVIGKRVERAAKAAEKQRHRADIAEIELRTLRAGLRANGADPTQLQNLWAQISLRNRQWRETKRELRLTRSMLEEEGGDVSLVDEMISTVQAAEAKARAAGAAIERVRNLVAGATNTTAAGISDYDIGRHDLAVAVLAALDEPAPAAGPAATCREHDGPCFPDPTATCPAHGDRQCAECHRNPSTCTDRDYVECGYWSSTGMHWDTCSNRIRGPLTLDTAATQGTEPQQCTCAGTDAGLNACATCPTPWPDVPGADRIRPRGGVPVACDAYQPPTTPEDTGLCAHCGMYDWKHNPASGPAATQATDPDMPPLAIPHDMATTLHRTLGQLLGDHDAQAIARIRALHREEYGSCAECTHESGVPYPCPTINALDQPKEQP